MRRRLALVGALALTSCGSSTIPAAYSIDRPYRDLPDVPRRTVVELPSQYDIPARLRATPDPMRVSAQRPSRTAPTRTRLSAPRAGGAAPLACIRSHESDTSGGYRAVSAGGKYRGAYQFDQSTWNGAVARAGYPEYSGTPAEQAPAEVQDAAARRLFAERGLQPWPPAMSCA